MFFLRRVHRWTRSQDETSCLREVLKRTSFNFTENFFMHEVPKSSYLEEAHQEAQGDDARGEPADHSAPDGVEVTDLLIDLATIEFM